MMKSLVANCFLLAFLVVQFSHCKEQQGCYALINKSNIKLNQEEICETLNKLQNDTIELAFFITDNIPGIVERDNIFRSSTSQLEKRSMVFIDFKSKDFAISYSDKLKEKYYLRSRYDFMKKIGKNLNSSNKTEMILNTINEFNQLFSISQ